MYSTIAGRDYNHMEQNKENFTQRENKMYNGNPFATPQKMNREIYTRDLLQTPAGNQTPYSQRAGGSLTQADTPLGKTNFKNPSEYGQSPSIRLLNHTDLPPLPQQITLADIQARIKQIFAKGSASAWEAKFEAISVLRTLNKFYPQEIFHIFNEFGSEILQCFSSEISYIQKNILLFALEVVGTEPIPDVDQRVVCVLLPCLLNRSISSSKELRDVAKDSLSYITRNHISEGSMTVLAKTARETKNRKIREYSVKMLSYGIETLQNRISSFSEQSLAQIFVTYAVLSETKIILLTEHSKGAANTFCQLMGFDNYTRFLKILLNTGLLTMHQANEMVEITKSHQSKVSTQQHLDNLRRTKQSCKKKTLSLSDDITQVLTDTATKRREQQIGCGFSSLNHSNAGNSYFK